MKGDIIYMVDWAKWYIIKVDWADGFYRYLAYKKNIFLAILWFFLFCQTSQKVIPIADTCIWCFQPNVHHHRMHVSFEPMTKVLVIHPPNNKQRHKKDIAWTLDVFFCNTVSEQNSQSSKSLYMSYNVIKTSFNL